MRYFLCAIGLAATLAATSCKPREFTCAMDNDCIASNGGYGLCVAEHCAFRDESCASHWRWDDTGGNVAEDCVPPEALDRPDAGQPQADAGPDAAVVPPPDAGAIDAGGLTDSAPASD